MITTLILGCLLQKPQVPDVLWQKTILNMPAKSKTALFYQGPVEPIEPPALSPKRFGISKIQWEFPWLRDGYTLYAGSTAQRSFQVFGQENKGESVGHVTQMLLRLWDLNYNRLGFVHSPTYNQGLVQVYLCFGGKAGGEQLFDVQQGMNTTTHRFVDVKVNTIYIYDIASFTDPIEMAREIAHEYGHATLPPIGGFKQPEEWSDGYLGEKLYLKWLRDGLVNGTIVSEDVLGATKEGLDKWLTANYDPVLEKAATTQPTVATLTDTSAVGMNQFIGMALEVDTIFGDSVFARSIKMTGSTEAKDYPAAAVLAVEEPDEITLNIPPNLVGKPIWIPLGTGKLKGAPWLKRDPNGWVQILPKGTPISISNIH
jgi:hypothetical protein